MTTNLNSSGICMNDVCWTLFTKYTRDYVFNTKIDYIIDGSSYEISGNEIYNVIKDEKFICNKENDRKIWTMN